MNNAIGLNNQTAPTIVAPQVLAVEPISATHSCKGSECSEQGSAFFDLLNTELEALVGTESHDLLALADPQVLESIGEVEELSELDVSSSVLASLLQHEEPVELVDTDFKELEAEFKIALVELPDDIIALPLTPENKIIIEQQALALVQHKHPELIAQIQQAEGQLLPLEGKLLPLIEETLLKQDAVKNIHVPSVDHSLIKDVIVKELDTKQLGLEAQTNKSPLELLSKNDSETELDSDFKTLFDQNEKHTNVMKEKVLTENGVGKNTAHVEGTPQKFSTEAISTAFNNALGANQASINTPTAAAVQSGSTLLMPQNPSPEQWGSALGDKVQWMINTKLESAEIRIDPPHLGKMDISIKMTDDGASVVIQTQHAATRELIDAASYRLKEMLEQAGHEHVDVDVSHKESNHAESEYAENNESNEQHAIDNIESKHEQKVTDNDVIAGTYSENGRPSLDLFV